MSEEARRVRHSRRQCSGSGDALGRLHSSFMRAFICPSPRRRGATGGVPSALIAERSKVFKKEEAESAIYICNGTAGASCGASPDVMKILLPPPDSFLGDVFAAFFARASSVVVVVVAAALLPPPPPLQGEFKKKMRWR